MSFGFFEALLLAGVVVALFGFGKLPTVAGDVARGIRRFKEEMSGADSKKVDPDQQS